VIAYRSLQCKPRSLQQNFHWRSARIMLEFARRQKEFMTYRISVRAIADMEAICDYIFKDNPSTQTRFVEQFSWRVF
jgi:hypothetical protein